MVMQQKEDRMQYPQSLRMQQQQQRYEFRIIVIRFTILLLCFGGAVSFHFSCRISNNQLIPRTLHDPWFTLDVTIAIPKVRIRTRTTLFATTMQPSFTAQVVTKKSSGSKNMLPNNRTISETTWQLLNETAIGSWNRSDFEVMEMIIESMSSQSHSRQSKRAALIVERFLHRIVQEQMAENPYADCVDMTALYTNLIDQWANCGDAGGAERAEDILDYFQSIYEEGDSYDPLLCGPSLQSFNSVIGAYARSGRSDAPQQAIRVLTKLYEWNKEGRANAAPNQESFARTFLDTPFSFDILSISHLSCFVRLLDVVVAPRCLASLGKNGYPGFARVGTENVSSHGYSCCVLSVSKT
jgi:hypothetical protein